MHYDIDDEDLETTNEECAFTVDDMKSLAKNYLNVFFKNLKTDQKFNADRLHTSRNVSMVLNLNICDGMPVIYDAMKPYFKNAEKGKIPKDIVFIMTELNRCSKLGLPKCFATGVIGVYLEVCMGCKLNFKE
jgi:hypothetical protein